MRSTPLPYAIENLDATQVFWALQTPGLSQEEIWQIFKQTTPPDIDTLYGLPDSPSDEDYARIIGFFLNETVTHQQAKHNPALAGRLKKTVKKIEQNLNESASGLQLLDRLTKPLLTWLESFAPSGKDVERERERVPAAVAAMDPPPAPSVRRMEAKPRPDVIDAEADAPAPPAMDAPPAPPAPTPSAVPVPIAPAPAAQPIPEHLRIENFRPEMVGAIFNELMDPHSTRDTKRAAKAVLSDPSVMRALDPNDFHTENTWLAIRSLNSAQPDERNAAHALLNSPRAIKRIVGHFEAGIAATATADTVGECIRDREHIDAKTSKAINMDLIRLTGDFSPDFSETTPEAIRSNLVGAADFLSAQGMDKVAKIYKRSAALFEIICKADNPASEAQHVLYPEHHFPRLSFAISDNPEVQARHIACHDIMGLQAWLDQLRSRDTFTVRKQLAQFKPKPDANSKETLDHLDQTWRDKIQPMLRHIHSVSPEHAKLTRAIVQKANYILQEERDKEESTAKAAATAVPEEDPTEFLEEMGSDTVELTLPGSVVAWLARRLEGLKLINKKTRRRAIMILGSLAFITTEVTGMTAMSAWTISQIAQLELPALTGGSQAPAPTPEVSPTPSPAPETPLDEVPLEEVEVIDLENIDLDSVETIEIED
jgi:hypothetical protein